MDKSIKLYSIREVQGESLWSPLSGETIRTVGIVTGVLHRGFYLQTPGSQWDGKGSTAIFVYSPDWLPDVDDLLEVSGTVVDYLKHELAKPVTQLKLDLVKPLSKASFPADKLVITPVDLSAASLAKDNRSLAIMLNSLEGMVVRLRVPHTFIAPSNPFADYVLIDEAAHGEQRALRTKHGGVLVSEENPSRWYPGFRMYNYNHAPRVNVGARLLSDIIGPLHYRVDAWQIAISTPFQVDNAFVEKTSTQLTPTPESITIMTLNCFNLDPKIEAEEKVQNPRQDIDDDWGDGRFHSLAQAIVLQAKCPDIVALQEIQDNDGAEQTLEVGADHTYGLLVKTIKQLSGIEYQWVNVNPVLGADGGQPGGNIRNGFLYNPARVSLVPDSVVVLGENDEAFIDSRKPLVAKFKHSTSGGELVCINLHLASKRHQRSIFAPELPGIDEKLPIRIAQAQLVANYAQETLRQGDEFYITGDFNDTEHSETLAAITGDYAANLVMCLPNHERFDYNHRGKLQVLMHGIVSHAMAAEHAEYEIIHGNELIGVQPGETSDKASDHAYVIARLNLQGL